MKKMIVRTGVKAGAIYNNHNPKKIVVRRA